ncbi:MAG: hypothetical protein ACNS62_12930 [Candidatus Cyclobacteriaceae bacterium M3_2C_046]
MPILNMIATGLTGSTSVTGIHQLLRNKKNTPRVDLLGAQGLKKLFYKRAKLPNKQAYWGSLAGDMIFNSFYYSLLTKVKKPVSTGLIMGLAIGVITMLSPEWLGLDKKFVQSSQKQKYLTIGYYTGAGLLAGILAKFIKK